MHTTQVFVMSVLFQKLIEAEHRKAKCNSNLKDQAMNDTDPNIQADNTHAQADPTTTPATPDAAAPVQPTSPDTGAVAAPQATPSTQPPSEQPTVPPTENTNAQQSAKNPFIDTAVAAAHLVDLLRQNPEAIQFLEALLVCLKPQNTQPPT